MHLVGALGPLIEAGRIKVYSCDSLAGRAFAAGTGSVEYRCWLLNRFEELRRAGGGAGDPHRLPRRGRRDRSPPAPRSAPSWRWRWPAATRGCSAPRSAMSGTYDLERLFGLRRHRRLLLRAPMSFLPNLGGAASRRAAPALRPPRLRRRALGGPRTTAGGWPGVLGAKGVPNRVDPWGPEYDHDWPTWRRMLPDYLDDAGLTRGGGAAMNVIFLEPGFPANQREFVRALASIGASVYGVGDRPYDWLDDELKGWLAGYQQIASVTDEGALEWAVRERAEARLDRPAGGGGRGARAAGGARARALHASRASRRAPPISAATRWR